jgi:hypothetical protein
MPGSAETRKRFCVIDVGSRNVKFVLTSVESQDLPSMRDEQQCYARLQLGERVIDAKTRRPLALRELDIEALNRILVEYVRKCDEGGGKMLGVLATEWGRQAKNPGEIQSRVKKRTGLAIEILPREREGRFGYLAATRGTQGNIVLDLGSRSVQLSYWARGAASPETVSLPYGIDAASSEIFNADPNQPFSDAKATYLGTTRAGLGQILVKIKNEIDRGTLNKELFSLGENGDVVLALRGQLWDEKTYTGIDESTYAALIKFFPPTRTSTHGLVTGLIPAADVTTLGMKLDQDPKLVSLLKSPDVRNVYGAKMLIMPTLVSMIAKELGIETLVLVPQELADGLVVDTLTNPAVSGEP